MVGGFRVARSMTERGVRRLLPIEWTYQGCSVAANTNGVAFGIDLWRPPCAPLNAS